MKANNRIPIALSRRHGVELFNSWHEKMRGFLQSEFLGLFLVVRSVAQTLGKFVVNRGQRS